MTYSNDFKNALRSGNLAEALALAMTKAVELQITTSIISADDCAPVGERLRTKINIVEGTIENEIGDKIFASKYYQELQKLHLQQVAEGNQILQQNLESLQKMFSLMAQQASSKNNSSSPQLIEKNNHSLSGFQITQIGNNIAEENNFSEETQEDYGLISLADLEPDAEEEEDWGEWLDEEQQTDTATEIIVPQLESLDLDDDENWEEWQETETNPGNSENSQIKEKP